MLAARGFAHSWLGVLATITLVGCASNRPEEAIKPTVQTYPKITKVSFNAYRPPPSAVSPRRLAFTVRALDADLFTEIGYGQLTLTVGGRGNDNYYVSVRIEKQPTGSKLTMISDNMAASQRYRELVSGWANGDQNCPAV